MNPESRFNYTKIIPNPINLIIDIFKSFGPLLDINQYGQDRGGDE
jgi:hypothetical protein